MAAGPIGPSAAALRARHAGPVVGRDASSAAVVQIPGTAPGGLVGPPAPGPPPLAGAAPGVMTSRGPPRRASRLASLTLRRPGAVRTKSNVPAPVTAGVTSTATR